MVGDDDAPRLGSGTTPGPPARVSLAPFSPFISPTPRRLSSCFNDPSRAATPAWKKLAWVSLQGRLVGAQEATSASSVGRCLAPPEAVAWELFSPLQRVLIVAIVAVAASKSKRARKIAQLHRSVDIRDQVLLSMQQKLDNLCEQMNSLQNESMKQSINFSSENHRFAAAQKLGRRGAKLCSNRCSILDLNPGSGITPLCKNLSHRLQDLNGIESTKDEMLKTSIMNMAEQEERRMSDLSDFCWSVTSSVDIQLNSLAAEQEFYNLRNECEEKDVTIKELTAAAHASSVAGSKRIMELEEIIRRKNMVISKLKKDMMFLEQQVIELTRLRRASCSASNSDIRQLPVMANNILYDMSSTSPSSSDCDSPVEHKELHSQGSIAYHSPQQEAFAVVESQRQPTTKSFSSLNRSSGRLQMRRSVSPLKENRMIQRAESNVVPRPRQLLSCSGDSKRIKRHTQQRSKNISAPQKRWV
uniref:Uncharacterized protein LOC105061278 n=1 Tax=Elaeis guineensis var. tenera TaxID=51953 RepID=A0A6I9SGZ1_ELAGV|nr:uncharacterized protein LOC105061278 [Elaeis guineensis]XP_019701590.1 uncharacterized protein LOC105061278 [Elaeis guineensis]